MGTKEKPWRMKQLKSREDATEERLESVKPVSTGKNQTNPSHNARPEPANRQPPSRQWSPTYPMPLILGDGIPDIHDSILAQPALEIAVVKFFNSQDDTKLFGFATTSQRSDWQKQKPNAKNPGVVGTNELFFHLYGGHWIDVSLSDCDTTDLADGVVGGVYATLRCCYKSNPLTIPSPGDELAIVRGFTTNSAGITQERIDRWCYADAYYDAVNQLAAMKLVRFIAVTTTKHGVKGVETTRVLWCGRNMRNFDALRQGKSETAQQLRVKPGVQNTETGCVRYLWEEFTCVTETDESDDSSGKTSPVWGWQQCDSPV